MELPAGGVTASGGSSGGLGTLTSPRPGRRVMTAVLQCRSARLHSAVTYDPFTTVTLENVSQCVPLTPGSPAISYSRYPTPPRPTTPTLPLLRAAVDSTTWLMASTAGEVDGVAVMDGVTVPVRDDDGVPDLLAVLEGVLVRDMLAVLEGVVVCVRDGVLVRDGEAVCVRVPVLLAVLVTDGVVVRDCDAVTDAVPVMVLLAERDAV